MCFNVILRKLVLRQNFETNFCVSIEFNMYLILQVLHKYYVGMHLKNVSMY
jgi:hypothetical protein